MDAVLLDALRQAVPQAEFDQAASADMPTVYLDRAHVLEAFEALRDHPSLGFQLLADVTAVDYLPAEPRFEVVYHLARIPTGAKTTSGVVSPGGRPETTPDVVLAPARLRVKVRIPGDDPRVASVVSIYPTAGWLEREVFDLMGISFDHHPDLRRILMPEDWTGHPLRKDYPVQIRKDTQSWQPVQLSVEEFAANVRSAREQAHRQAERPATGTRSD